jgi:hypothetical protein
MNKKGFFYIIAIFLIFFLENCSTKGSIENNYTNQIEDKVSLESNNKLNPDYVSFPGFDMIEDEIKFKINGKNLALKLPIYLDKNRYYICLNEFIEQLNGEIEKTDTLLDIKVNNKSYSIDLSNNIIKYSNNKFPLKKSLLNKNDIYYIGFSDFSHMFNLYTRWDKNNKIIDCKIDGFNTKNITPYKSTINQIGFMRFEDIGLNSQPYSKEYFEKLRIIANYMYQKEIPYHIAWIPRYVIPKQGVDNDPLTKNNFEIAEMVYSLDYFATHNGIIGLHGYTHQCDDDESGAGFEFGKFEPSIDIFKEKIEKALETASYLDVPVDFFEAPHYEITPDQNKIAEKYFKILYYPFNDYGRDKADLRKPQLSPYNKSSYYISTPLDYIPVNREESTLTKIKNADTTKMGSIFFHPALENSYISLTEDNNHIPTFTYADNSVLKRLIMILEEKGFNIEKVTDI